MPLRNCQGSEMGWCGVLYSLTSSLHNAFAEHVGTLHNPTLNVLSAVRSVEANVN